MMCAAENKHSNTNQWDSAVTTRYVRKQAK